TPDMIRAARGYLNWSQHELGQRCNLSKVSLVGIESGRQHPNHETLKRIASVFWNEGLIFLPEGGFRVENSLIQVLEGSEGVKSFFNDVLSVAENKGGEFLISGVRDSDFARIVEEVGIRESYVKKMNELFEKKKVIHKNLAEKGSVERPLQAYSEYRIVPDGQFENVPFYLYGNKLAIILWGENIKIICMENSELATAYKKIFDLAWKQSTPLEA
ncbi:MAG: helix-turn-helix transcriptional regulator, partial [Alphaproteobacteria bacterium]|nr:helix-turn-helix transcriptional regulator [Alphaproteobacteria bacterium]